MKKIAAFYKNKNVLITGGAGFIGSHIAQKLVDLGANITILDNFSTGSFDNIPTSGGAIQVIKGNIADKDLVNIVTQGQDVIFHLAAFVSVPQSIESPDECNRTNITGTEILLEAAVKNNVKSFVFSSSSAIYGEHAEPCIETSELRPQSPYAASKIEGEKLCREYAISTACLRYFNVYGPRQNPNGQYAAVVARFTEQLTYGRPIEIYGDGSQTRDFIHVDEVVTANLAMGMMTGLKGEPFNIASGQSINLIQLIDRLESELEVPPTEVIFKPARSGDVKHSQADCSKYRTFLKDLGL